MALINTAVGLLAISSPIGVLPVVAKAAGGEPTRVRRISRLAVLTFLFTLLAIGIYLLLLVSMPLRRALGELQEKVISSLMGLLLSAIAVQMLESDLKGCFPVLG